MPNPKKRGRPRAKFKKPVIQRHEGRPLVYSTALAKRICDEIGNGASLKTICEREDMPEGHTVQAWIDGDPVVPVEYHREFSALYARACERRGHVMAEDALRIADEEIPSDNPQAASAAVQRARLRVDTRKWFASKLHPRIYGDRIELPPTVASGTGPSVLMLAPVDWDAMLAKAKGRVIESEPAALPPAGASDPAGG